MRVTVSPAAERLLTRTWFRWFVAVVLVGGHLATTMSFASERYGWTAFNLAPGQPPVFVDVEHDPYPTDGKRLIVSRWDAEHYMGIAMRGYSQCPHRKLVADDMRGPICDVAFYPGYPALGAWVRRVTGLPIDYAMLAVSLTAAVVTLFLWTDATIVAAIGLGGAYGSLFAFNFFPSACYLVFLSTDGGAAAGILAGFVALARRRYILAALAIGFAGAMRISGVAAEAGFALAVVAWCLREPPAGEHRLRQWIGRALLVPLGAWGTLVISTYHWVRLGDPLLYLHGHAASFHHTGSPLLLLDIQPEWIIHAMDGPLHDLVWAFGLGMFALVGHRAALANFPLPAQVYAYAVAVFTYFMSISGTIDLYNMQGLSRYVLVVFLGFLAIGGLLKRHPAALLVWLLACAWHSREVDLCYYLGDVGQHGLRKCNLTQWLDR